MNTDFPKNFDQPCLDLLFTICQCHLSYLNINNDEIAFLWFLKTQHPFVGSEYIHNFIVIYQTSVFVISISKKVIIIKFFQKQTHQPSRIRSKFQFFYAPANFQNTIFCHPILNIILYLLRERTNLCLLSPKRIEDWRLFCLQGIPSWLKCLLSRPNRKRRRLFNVTAA